MEQKIRDEGELRSTSHKNSSVEERFEAVQDEVNLLKAQIQQTLIDLREFIMKGRVISPQGAFGGLGEHPANGAGDVEGNQYSPPPQMAPTPQVIVSGDQYSPPSQMAPTPQVIVSGDQYSPPPQMASTPPAPVSGEQYSPPPQTAPTPSAPPAPPETQGDAVGRHTMDATKMGHIIWWLGTVKSRGLSPTQLKPFLQAYEVSGHLTPGMAKLTYRSLEDLDSVEEPHPDQGFSATDYSDCLMQLHDIICTPGYVPNDDTPTSRPRPTRQSTSQTRQPDEDTVQVPDSSPVPEQMNIPVPVHDVAPRPQTANPQEPADNGRVQRRKGKRARSDQQSAAPREEAGRDSLGGNGLNG